MDVGVEVGYRYCKSNLVIVLWGVFGEVRFCMIFFVMGFLLEYFGCFVFRMILMLLKGLYSSRYIDILRNNIIFLKNKIW